MKYTKPAFSFEQQAQRLLERGLIVPDKAILVKRLSTVNYYRLSAYWYPFKEVDSVTGEERFAPNTAFEVIWRRYTFDRRLRLPLWMAVEVMTFGQLFTLFRNLHRSEQKELSKAVGLYPPVLISWLHTLNFIRNACAHHSRLWNRKLPIRPMLPDARHHPEWHIPVTLDNRRMFAVLTLMRYLLTYIDPQNDWQARLEQLLADYPELPIHWMGFPKNWHECPIWVTNSR